MENESQRIQVDPRNIHYTKRNVSPGPYKQRGTPPRRRYQISWATPWQKTYLAQTETTRNHPHQNVLVTRTQVKTVYKQQTFSYKTILKPICITLGYGFHFQHWNSRTFPMGSLAQLGMCRIRLSEGISTHQQLQKKSAATALNTVLASAHIQMTNNKPIELPDNRRLCRHLPNDLPTRFLV
jgi:hypothetical protein